MVRNRARAQVSSCPKGQVNLRAVGRGGLKNLIVNAEQAIREARDRGTLRIRLGKSNGSVWASFQDDGIGIPAENISRIFDPFYTTKRPGRGTGLGLSICKSIMKEHNGNVEAVNAPGGGAVFTVSLPTATHG